MNKTVILALITLFVTICSAEHEVLSRDPERDDALNSIPKDKFIFIQIDEKNYDTFAPSVLMKTAQRPYNFVEKDNRVYLHTDKIQESVMIIVGHNIYFLGEGRHASFARLYEIESLPQTVEISKTSEEALLSNLRRLVNDVNIVNFDKIGRVVIKYKDKLIKLKPRQSWTQEHNFEISGMKCKTILEITNWGLISKANMEGELR